MSQQFIPYINVVNERRIPGDVLSNCEFTAKELDSFDKFALDVNYGCTLRLQHTVDTVYADRHELEYRKEQMAQRLNELFYGEFLGDMLQIRYILSNMLPPHKSVKVLDGLDRIIQKLKPHMLPL